MATYLNPDSIMDQSLTKRMFSSDINMGNYQEITYGNLLKLKNGNNLVPGNLYRITDYLTTIKSDYGNVCIGGSGMDFDVVVLAISDHEIDENAYIVSISEDLSNYDIKYDINNDDTKYPWIDNSSIKISQDTYRDNEDSALIFSKSNETITIDDETDNYGQLINWTVWENDSFHTYDQNTKVSRFLLTRDEFPEIDTQMSLVHSKYDISLYKQVYYDFQPDICNIMEVIYPSTGVIYYMRDDKGNSAPYDFKNILFDETIFTFTYDHGEYIEDATRYQNFRNNVIESNPTHKNLIYVSNSDLNEDLIENNIIKKGSKYCRIENGSNNIIGENCYGVVIQGSNNIIGDKNIRDYDGDGRFEISGLNNIIGTENQMVTISGDYNTVGNKNSNIEIVGQENIIGSNNTIIKLLSSEKYSTGNIIRNGCGGISITQGLKNNINDYCSSITLIPFNSYNVPENNIIGEQCRNITLRGSNNVIGDQNGNLNISYSKNLTSDPNVKGLSISQEPGISLDEMGYVQNLFLKNYRILSGNYLISKTEEGYGQYFVPNSVSITNDLKNHTIGINSNGDVKIFNIIDLING